NARLVGGVAYIYAKIAEPGVIEHYKRGSVVVGAWRQAAAPDVSQKKESDIQVGAGKGPFARLGEMRRQPTHVTAPVKRAIGGADLGAIQTLFDGAGIPCQVVEDIRRTKWEKMCWNVVFNPLTILLNDRVSKALAHPEMHAMIKLLVGEAVAVARAEGVELDPDIAGKVVQWAEEIRDIHTSMYDDWKAGRRTEIDFLNGYLVRLGRKLGVATPVNEAVCALIKTITEPAPLGTALLRLDGAVIQPLVFDLDALSKLPASDQVPDVSVEDPSMRGQGVRVRALLNAATCTIGADHVTFHSADGQYAASLHLKEAAESGILLYQLEGRPLRREEGGPFRLISPSLGDWGASVKSVRRIEFTVGPGKDSRPEASHA